MIPYIILIVVILGTLVIYKFRSVISDFNSILSKIHHGENEIDELLNKKAKLLDDVCEEINSLNDNKVFSSVQKVMQKNLDSFKLDKDLAEIYCELKEYLLVNKSFVPEEDVKKKIEDLATLELDLEATKTFYNDNSNVFNELLEKFPSKVVANRKGYDTKNLYTFNEEEFFEILKKDKKKKKEVKNA